MTIKEIADLTNKSKRAIEILLTSEKISHIIRKKISQAIKTKIAADFTLDETIEILRVGRMSESLISLLRENAMKKNNEVTIKENSFIGIISDLIKQNQQFQLQILSEIKNLTNNNQVKQIENNEKEKISVESYCKKNNIRPYLYLDFYKLVGRRCTNLSRQLQRSVKYQKEGNWDVGLYDIDIVKNCVENELIAIERNKSLFYKK